MLLWARSFEHSWENVTFLKRPSDVFFATRCEGGAHSILPADCIIPLSCHSYLPTYHSLKRKTFLSRPETLTR